MTLHIELLEHMFTIISNNTNMYKKSFNMNLFCMYYCCYCCCCYYYYYYYCPLNMSPWGPRFSGPALLLLCPKSKPISERCSYCLCFAKSAGTHLRTLGASSSKLILDEIHYANFQPKIRRTKHNLIIKLIIWMDGKSRDKSIKPN